VREGKLKFENECLYFICLLAVLRRITISKVTFAYIQTLFDYNLQLSLGGFFVLKMSKK